MATSINTGRWVAEVEGDFVVFLIGYRPTKGRRLRAFGDLGGRRGMFAMLDELTDDPDSGLLGYESSTFGGLMVQYWRSFEDLERFANGPDNLHTRAWRTYWKRVGKADGTGIWHETYLVRAGDYEAVYANMPAFGLGKATRLAPLAGSSSARSRIGRRASATGGAGAG